MGAFLAISLGVGVYYGVIKKQRTTEEYLLGNRHMQLLPVALSMLVTYQSAISVIGIPAEFYLYNSMLCYVFLGIAAVILIQCFMIVPLMYPLHLTSAYEVNVYFWCFAYYCPYHSSLHSLTIYTQVWVKIRSNTVVTSRHVLEVTGSITVWPRFWTQKSLIKIICKEAVTP